MKLLKALLSINIFLMFAFAAPAFALATTNLNTATQTELEALPGVGKKMAEAIIAKRPFKSVEDLKEVKGVGDAKFAKLKELVSVDGATAAMPTTAKATATAAATTATTAAATTAKATTGHAEKAHVSQLAAGEKISLNSGSLEQLEKLPGVGPKKAQAIIDARPFKSIEDVMKVKGIKAGIFAKIKDNISL